MEQKHTLCVTNNAGIPSLQAPSRSSLLHQSEERDRPGRTPTDRLRKEQRRPSRYGSRRKHRWHHLTSSRRPPKRFPIERSRWWTSASFRRSARDHALPARFIWRAHHESAESNARPWRPKPRRRTSSAGSMRKVGITPGPIPRIRESHPILTAPSPSGRAGMKGMRKRQAERWT